MDQLVPKLANLLISCDRVTTTYAQDAEKVIKGLKEHGYFISKNEEPFVKWRDASTATVKGWAIVIYKRYDVQGNEFDYHPKLIRGYTSDEDLIKGETRAHLLYEFELPNE